MERVNSTSFVPSGEVFQDESNNCGMWCKLQDDPCQQGCSKNKYGRWSHTHILWFQTIIPQRSPSLTEPEDWNDLWTACCISLLQKLLLNCVPLRGKKQNNNKNTWSWSRSLQMLEGTWDMLRHLKLLPLGCLKGHRLGSALWAGTCPCLSLIVFAVLCIHPLVMLSGIPNCRNAAKMLSGYFSLENCVWAAAWQRLLPWGSLCHNRQLGRICNCPAVVCCLLHLFSWLLYGTVFQLGCRLFSSVKLPKQLK